MRPALYRDPSIRTSAYRTAIVQTGAPHTCPAPITPNLLISAACASINTRLLELNCRDWRHCMHVQRCEMQRADREANIAETVCDVDDLDNYGATMLRTCEGTCRVELSFGWLHMSRGPMALHVTFSTCTKSNTALHIPPYSVSRWFRCKGSKTRSIQLSIMNS